MERARASTSTAVLTVHYAFDLSNFRRKVLSTMAFVVPVDAEPQPAHGGRPADLYRARTARLLHPSLLSPASRAAALLDDADPDEYEP